MREFLISRDITSMSLLWDKYPRCPLACWDFNYLANTNPILLSYFVLLQRSLFCMTLYLQSEVGEDCEIIFFSVLPNWSGFGEQRKYFWGNVLWNTMFTSSHALDFVGKTAKQLIYKTKSCKYTTSIVIVLPFLSGMLHSRNLARLWFSGQS